jgi:hypothetical protein
MLSGRVPACVQVTEFLLNRDSQPQRGINAVSASSAARAPPSTLPIEATRGWAWRDGSVI